MYITLRSEAVVDLDAASNTTAFVVTPNVAGTLYVKQIIGRVEEAIAAGGFSSTAGVLSVTAQPSGGSEVDLCTYSTTVAPAAGQAIGNTINVTVDPTNTGTIDGAYVFEPNTTFRVKTKTQGAGGTVTGTVRVFLPFDLNKG